ncbi:hypothetical protein LshimejAT787_0209670 [Lyophyllum shimeji]|uniref:Uncharacterized protein n=1 Tax=Lyophyllum shimeji TaxID=47721 RepID=A0A9P3PHB7_LYOSH|nr:hypothetical protein LshimejAT787_0209670 [Lyophyllum shimeji]
MTKRSASYHRCIFYTHPVNNIQTPSACPSEPAQRACSPQQQFERGGHIAKVYATAADYERRTLTSSGSRKRARNGRRPEDPAKDRDSCPYCLADGKTKKQNTLASSSSKAEHD